MRKKLTVVTKQTHTDIICDLCGKKERYFQSVHGDTILIGWFSPVSPGADVCIRCLRSLGIGVAEFGDTLEFMRLDEHFGKNPWYGYCPEIETLIVDLVKISKRR